MPALRVLRQGPARRRSRGQSLAEFALVAPVVLAVLGGIIQFGILFWAQNTITQVVRDTGRWAATQPNCSDPSLVVDQANVIAATSALMGYSTTTFNVTVSWDSSTCPVDNTTVNYVHVTAIQKVPTFFPGMEYLPALGTCDGSGCHVDVTSTAQFRMEPNPNP